MLPKQLSDDIQVKLVGPSGRIYEPIDHTGYGNNFIVEPHFASGPYHFRFEKWANTEVIEQVETPDLLQIKTATRQIEIGPVSHPLRANFAKYLAWQGMIYPNEK